jgi:hypothetical protein
MLLINIAFNKTSRDLQVLLAVTECLVGKLAPATFLILKVELSLIFSDTWRSTLSILKQYLNLSFKTLKKNNDNDGRGDNGGGDDDDNNNNRLPDNR